jgi:hypothetical protein
MNRRFAAGRRGSSTGAGKFARASSSAAGTVVGVVGRSGQQTPIVQAAEGRPNRYVVIDGYKWIAAEQLGQCHQSSENVFF